MLKFSLKRDAFDFTGHLVTPEADLLDEADDTPDLLAQIASDTSGKMMDAVLAAMGKDDEARDEEYYISTL